MLRSLQKTPRHKTRQAEGWKLDAVLRSRREIHKKISSSEISVVFMHPASLTEMILAISYLCSHATLYFASFHPHIRNFFMIASASITNLIFSCSAARRDYFFPFFGFFSISPNRNLHCWWSFSIAVCVLVRDYRGRGVLVMSANKGDLCLPCADMFDLRDPENRLRQVIWSPDDSFLAKILIFQLNLCFFRRPRLPSDALSLIDAFLIHFLCLPLYRLLTSLGHLWKIVFAVFRLNSNFRHRQSFFAIIKLSWLAPSTSPSPFNHSPIIEPNFVPLTTAIALFRHFWVSNCKTTKKKVK